MNWIMSLFWRAEPPAPLPTDPPGFLKARCIVCHTADWRWRLTSEWPTCRDRMACYRRSRR